MLRSELVRRLNELPDIEVGDYDAQMLIGVEKSCYDDDDGSHDYICLEFEEG